MNKPPIFCLKLYFEMKISQKRKWKHDLTFRTKELLRTKKFFFLLRVCSNRVLFCRNFAVSHVDIAFQKCYNIILYTSLYLYRFQSNIVRYERI